MYQRFRVLISLQHLSPVFNETRPERVLEHDLRSDKSKPSITPLESGRIPAARGATFDDRVQKGSGDRQPFVGGLIVEIGNVDGLFRVAGDPIVRRKLDSR
jgi:hypothetical protein